ncbi:hypothetical protein FD754_012892 [Muntiacus muntjak]|uniref:F-box/LRR-repeat protein 15-like leucin rich repeat domain-containing protein n=1 Tax=Muntiacus muntjak TaxID=9888 RepID=A0A5N3VI95_MUNMU|nr:hypothetical protein FD754_012892 [Muntiacus muntjak]
MAECCLVRGRELAQSLGSVCGPPPPLASLSLAYCSSLKVSVPLPSSPGPGIGGAGSLAPGRCPVFVSKSAGRGMVPRQTVRCPHSSLPPPWWVHAEGGPGDQRGPAHEVTHTSQPHEELQHWASSPKDLSPQPQGPSLLMLQALRELDLTACSKLTDASLTKVLRFPQLRQLSLSLLPALTDKALVAVAKGCPSLERLALSHCSLLSDHGWAQVASFWPRLQHLNLSSCSQLTEQTLDSIGQACRQLRMVDVAMCPGISIASVRRFQARLPEVTCIQSRFVGGADLTLTL